MRSFEDCIQSSKVTREEGTQPESSTVFYNQGHVNSCQMRVQNSMVYGVIKFQESTAVKVIFTTLRRLKAQNARFSPPPTTYNNYT